MQHYCIKKGGLRQWTGGRRRQQRKRALVWQYQESHWYVNNKTVTHLITRKQNLTVFIFISSILENSVYFSYSLYFFFGKVSIQILCLFLYLRQWNQIWLIVNTINSWRTLCFVEFSYCLGYISWLFRFNDYYSFLMPILYYHNYCSSFNIHFFLIFWIMIPFYVPTFFGTSQKSRWISALSGFKKNLDRNLIIITEKLMNYFEGTLISL